MAKYIEREKYVKLNDIIETLEHEWGYEGMREDLYNLPTADVVEVVRCKDCQHARQTVYGNYHCLVDHRLAHEETDYCSCGEKKEGAE